MMPVVSTSDIAEWAVQLEGWAAELKQKIPEVQALGGRVKVPGKTFHRLHTEARRLIGSIELEGVRARRRLILQTPPNKRRNPKRGSEKN